MMASATPSTNKTCPMCLEPQDVLKVVGSCRHSFCIRCLTGHLDRHKADDETFPCPICNVPCVLPGGDMNNLPSEGVEEATEVTDSQTVDEYASVCVAANRANNTAGLDNKTVDVKCQICHHRKKDVQAVNLCPKCDQLHLCEECSMKHARNKATKDHVLVPLRAPDNQGDARCITHDAPLTKYCCDCRQPTCKIGMMLEHEEHDIEDMCETILRSVEDLKGVVEQRNGEFTKLQCLTKKLATLKNIAPTIDREDELLKEIEDHAQVCMDGIVAWKEDMKEEVKKEFQVVKDIPEAYETASNILRKLEKPLPKAAKLLTETSQDPLYLNRLVTVRKDLEEVPKMDEETDANIYCQTLQELAQNDVTFCPCPLPSLGKISKKKKDAEFEPKAVFSKKIEVESKVAFIPCVVHLGNKLAIANPTTYGQQSHSIHIYEHGGEFCRTLKDHVGPIYDMSSFGDGKLVVLSNGTDGVSPCSIKVLDPDTGNLVVAHNLDVEKPMSLGVSPDNQYFILGDSGEGKRQVTSVDMDGRVEYTQTSEMTPDVNYTSKISCSWQYVFVMGEKNVAVLERKDSELAQVENIADGILGPFDHAKDMHALYWDCLFLAKYWDGRSEKIFLYKYFLDGKQTKTKWKSSGGKSIQDFLSRAERECRISGTGNSIVVSHGQKFTVYKL